MSDGKRNRASSAARFAWCPGSIQMCQGLPEGIETDVQRAGQQAHRLLEEMLNEGERNVDYSRWPMEMVENVKWAHGVIQETIQSDQMSFYCAEQQGDLSSIGMPECGGTADAVVMTERLLHIFDLKYGFREVSAEWNWQMLIYALCFLSVGKYSIRRIHLHILQPALAYPRHDEWTISAKRLAEWVPELREAYEESFEKDARLNPSPATCLYCRASGVCRAQKNRALRRYEKRSDMLDYLTPKEMGKLLEREADVRLFFRSLRARIMEMWRRGEAVPGTKIVQSNKHFIFPEEAVRRLKKRVPHEDLFVEKMKSPAQLAKDPRYRGLAEKLRVKPVGEARLALATDKRNAVPLNRVEFTVYEEDEENGNG